MKINTFLQGKQSNSKVINITHDIDPSQDMKANYDVDILNIAIKRKAINSEKKKSKFNLCENLKDLNKSKVICTNTESHSPVNNGNKLPKETKKVQVTVPQSIIGSGLQSPDHQKIPPKHKKNNSTQFSKINKFIQTIGMKKISPLEIPIKKPIKSTNVPNTKEVKVAKLSTENVEKLEYQKDATELTNKIKNRNLIIKNYFV